MNTEEFEKNGHKRHLVRNNSHSYLLYCFFVFFIGISAAEMYVEETISNVGYAGETAISDSGSRCWHEVSTSAKPSGAGKKDKQDNDKILKLIERSNRRNSC